MLAEIREFLDRIHKINRMIALSNTIDFGIRVLNCFISGCVFNLAWNLG